MPLFPTAPLRWRPIVSGAAVALLSVSASVSAQSGAIQSAPPSSGFEQDIRPFLSRYCVRCHGARKQKGGLALHTATGGFEDDAAAEQWIGILEKLTFGEMPPPKTRRQPKPLETARVVGWIKQRLEQTGAGEAYRKKLLAPEYGNWVNHDKLFSGEITTPPFSPSRLWRVSPQAFLRRGFPNARSPFTFVTPENGIRDYSVMSGVDQSTVQMILINARQVLEHRERRGDFARFADGQQTPPREELERTVRREFERIVGRHASDQERAKYLGFLEQNIEVGGNLAGLKTTITAMFLSPEATYRQELGLGPTDRHGRRMLSSDEAAHAIAYALTDRGPQHTEAIRKAQREGKLTKKQEVAKLVRAVLEQELGQGNWSHPKLPRIMRFFEEFFGFDRAESVFKDQQRVHKENIPQWNPSMLIYDARQIIEYHLERDRDVIAELLTTDRYFIAHPGDNDYAREFYEQTLAEVTDPGYVAAKVEERRASIDRNPDLKPKDRASQLDNVKKHAEWKVRRFREAAKAGMTAFPSFPYTRRSRGIGDLLYIEPYNLPPSGSHDLQIWAWPIEQPIDMPKEQRAGLLTHPAWLATYSLNEGNDPVRRGIWVREKLLAGVIQDVPPDVDAMVSNDPHKTLRERHEPLRAERCWACHRKINPLGEAFEMFDDWGRFRSQHYFDEEGKLVTRRDHVFKRMLEKGQLTTRAVDASGAITGSGDPEVDGPVKDAVEMMRRLGRSDRARQSFIRHLFRYFMGRNEMLSDSQTLIEAERAYLESDGSFRALVVSLLSSDSFLYRR